MRNADIDHDIQLLLNTLREKLPQNDVVMHLVSELLTNLSQTLLSPVAAILGMSQALQRQSLTQEQQKDYISHIYQTSSETLVLINSLMEHAHIIPGQIQESGAHYDAKGNVADEYAELRNIYTLIIDEDKTRREILRQQLKAIGLVCDVVDPEAALKTLYAAKDNPYQIAVLSAQHFNHHIAYLVRTIRANTALAQVMPVLAVTTEIPDFEKESAHFNGFACVVNSLKPTRLPNKLLNSWRGWAAKINFSPTTAEVPVQAVARGKNRILLVEDDPIPQKVMQRQLAELGYTIDTASNGHTALKFLEQEIYDLVFMDVGLPDISGLEVTAEFRKRETGDHRTPIIGLTMHALGSDQEMGLQAGMNEYLVKPLLQDRLKIVLQQWIKN